MNFVSFSGLKVDYNNYFVVNVYYYYYYCYRYYYYCQYNFFIESIYFILDTSINFKTIKCDSLKGEVVRQLQGYRASCYDNNKYYYVIMNL